MNRVKIYIELAINALETVVNRLPDNKTAFMDNEVLQDATLMRLQEAGEYLIQLRENSSAYYDQHSTDAWHKLIGLRKIISHGYAQIEMDKIWIVVTVDVSSLLEELKRLS